MMQKKLPNVLVSQQYKFAHAQESLLVDVPVRQSYIFEFLVYLKVDDDYPWKILWANKIYFYLQFFFKAQYCRIRRKENVFAHDKMLHYSVKLTVRQRLTVFIVRPVFFQEICQPVLLSCTVNSKRYESISLSKIITTVNNMYESIKTFSCKIVLLHTFKRH